MYNHYFLSFVLVLTKEKRFCLLVYLSTDAHDIKVNIDRINLQNRRFRRRDNRWLPAPSRYARRKTGGSSTENLSFPEGKSESAETP